MSLPHLRSVLLLTLLLVVLVAPGQASYIAGKLDFSGDGVIVNNLGIDWLPQNLASATPPPSSTGDFRYQGPNHSGSFFSPSLVAGLLLGSIRDLPSGLGSGPLGANSLNNFLAFNTAYSPLLAGANFVLTNLQQGNIAPNNPIALTQSGSTVFAGISGNGYIFDNGNVSKFRVSFTTQFNDTTIAEVIAAGQTPAGIAASWSGSLTANTPEPASALLCGSTLLGLGWIIRRRRRA